MRIIFFLSILFLGGCATKPLCLNSNDGFRSVLDPDRGCSVRIRQVIVGSDLELPKSLSFKSSDTQWSYRWVESSFKNGALELGHFVLIPAGQGGSQ